jgi:hypothetical protein
MANAMGMDNRSFLPPFFPILRNEDGVFGAIISKCFGEAYFGHVPYTVVHSPEQPRTFLVGPAVAFAHSRFCDLLQACFESYGESLPVGQDNNRLIGMANHLIAIGNLSHDDFREYVSLAMLRRALTKYRAIETTLAINEDAPPYWRVDAKAALDHLERSVADGEYLKPVDLTLPPDRANTIFEKSQHLLARFGYLLRDWPVLINAVQDLRRREIRLASPIT